MDIPFDRLGIPKDLRDKLIPSAPVKLRLAAAKGLLPVPPDIAMACAYVCAGDPDPAVRDAAVEYFRRLDPTTSIPAINQRTHPKVLEMLAEHRRSDASLMEKVLTVRNANDRTCRLIASDASGALLEAIVRNQERLLMTPAIYLDLQKNPNCSGAQIERVSAFLRMEQALPAEEPESLPPMDKSAAAPARDLAAEVEAALLGLPSPSTNPEVADKLDMFDVDNIAAPGMAFGGVGAFQFNFADDEDVFGLEMTDEEARLDQDEIINITRRIMGMTVAQRIKLAYVGNGEARKILLRDRNKMVSMAVVKSGRMTDGEATNAAGNRNLPTEVIRELAMNREYMRKYPIKVAMANNPKTPLDVSISLVKQLQTNDLAVLSRNKNVSAAVFGMAAKMARERKAN